MGNCGSPIETEHGWLVLTHGVGPMRDYALGALLLDLDEPGRVIAELPGALLTSQGPERDGYVPNVVYSCGGLLHEGVVWIPYGGRRHPHRLRHRSAAHPDRGHATGRSLIREDSAGRSSWPGHDGGGAEVPAPRPPRRLRSR